MYASITAYLSTAVQMQAHYWLDRKNDEGASAVEYGLLVAAIAAVIVAILFTFGKTISTVFTNTNTCITNKGGTGC